MLGRGLESLIPQKNNNNDEVGNEPNRQEPGQIKNDFGSDNDGNNSNGGNNPHSNPQSGGSGGFSRPSDLINPVNSANPANPTNPTNSLNQATPPFQKTDEQPARKAPAGDHIFHIEIDKIKPNPYQPRKDFNEESLKELASSIREFGILQPIVISKNERDTDGGTVVEYHLIAGERRLKAAKMLGFPRVPAIIKRINPGAETMEMAIVENLQRQNLNPVETARAYSRLSDEFGLTQREIAVKVGKSRETVANALRLLSLPTEIQDAVAEGKISESQARLIVGVEDTARQTEIFRDLLLNNLSVRELKNRIRGGLAAKAKNFAVSAGADAEISHYKERLEELLGAPVTIESTKKGGKIVISFFSSEEVRGIIEKINRAGDGN